MTIQLAVSTFFGAFIFPFLIIICWDEMVKAFGAVGGWMAAGLIVGTTWTLNHGVGMIYQSGGAWVDMALAAGVGLLASSIYKGHSFKKAIPTILSSIIGGIGGGFIIAAFI